MRQNSRHVRFPTGWVTSTLTVPHKTDANTAQAGLRNCHPSYRPPDTDACHPPPEPEATSRHRWHAGAAIARPPTQTLRRWHRRAEEGGRPSIRFRSGRTLAPVHGPLRSGAAARLRCEAVAGSCSVVAWSNRWSCSRLIGCVSKAWCCRRHAARYPAWRSTSPASPSVAVGSPVPANSPSRPNPPPGKPSSPPELAEKFRRVEAAWRALIADTPLPVVRAGAIAGFGRHRICQIENTINGPRGDNA